VRVCEIGPEGTTLKPERAKHNRGDTEINYQTNMIYWEKRRVYGTHN
jgi:hypothetical protein